MILPQSSEGGDLTQNATSVDALLRDLRASRRTLENLCIDTFKSFANRPSEWATEAYDERAELLSLKKEAFFGMVNALIEKCDSCESDRHAEVLDICDLFKMKISLFWDEFIHFSRMEVNLTDMEPIAQGILESNVGVNRFSPIDASNDSYDRPAPDQGLA